MEFSANTGSNNNVIAASWQNLLVKLSLQLRDTYMPSIGENDEVV